MAVIMDPIGVYLYASSTILLFAAKDFVILRLWTLFGRLFGLLCPPSKVDAAAASASDKKGRKRMSIRTKRLITCQEISDLVFSLFMALITSWVLFTTPALSCVFVFANTDVLRLVIVLMSVQIGKMLFKVFFYCFVKFSPLHLVHCSILSICYVSFLCPGASTAIGLIGVVCDAADVHRHIGKLLDIWDVPGYAKSRIASHVAGTVANVIVRCGLLLGVIIMTIHQGNPITMTKGGLALFFFFLTYLATINMAFVITGASGLRDAIQLRRLYNSAKRDRSKTLQFVLDMRGADIWYPKNNLLGQMKQGVATVVQPEQQSNKTVDVV